MTTFLMLPPVDSNMRSWAERLSADCPEIEVHVVDDEAQLPQVLSTADAAYGWVPPDVLQYAKQLRWLQNPMAGPPPDYYYPTLVDHPVVVTNPRGIYSDHIAHHVLMYMLALSRGLPYYMDAQRERRWNRNARRHGYLDISQSHVLVVGVGGIGAEVGRLCLAMGATVTGIDPRLEQPVEFEVSEPASLESQLGSADFVVSTVPHTKQTEYMWDERCFDTMKPSAYFINIGRGMTTRLDALHAAILNHRIAGAGLDVFEIEPLPADHPLWSCENVIITPHVAVADADNISERRYQLLLDNARRFVANQPLRNVVDKALRY